MTALATTSPRSTPDPLADGLPSAEPDIPTSELVKEAILQAKELTKLEIALARDEMLHEITELKAALILLGMAAALSSLGVSVIVVALALFTGSIVATLGIGVAILALGLVLGSSGWSKLPKKPMGRTAERLQADVHDLKERMG